MKLYDLTIPPGQRASFHHTHACVRWNVGSGACAHNPRSKPDQWTHSCPAAGPALSSSVDALGAANSSNSEPRQHRTRDIKQISHASRVIANLLDQVDALKAKKHSLLEAKINQIVPDRTVFYYAGEAGGCWWDITNMSTTENFRQVVVEFLEETPKYSEEQVKQLLNNATFTTAVGTELLLENNRCK